MGISFMALFNLSTSSLDVPIVVDSAVTGNDVAGAAVGASEAASVEGTAIDTIGMMFAEVDATQSISIGLNCPIISHFPLVDH